MAGCGTLFPTCSMPSWSIYAATSEPLRGRSAVGTRPLRASSVASAHAGRAGGSEVQRQLHEEPAPKPVHPATRQPASASALRRAGDVDVRPRMSPTSSTRKRAAVMAPAWTPPEVVHVRDRRSSGPCGTARARGAATRARRSPSTAARIWSTSPSSLPITPPPPAERPQHGAREGGDVDDGVGGLFGGQHQRVAHDQPTLSVGVGDLDGLAPSHRDHIAHLQGRAGGHVVGAHEVAGDGRPAVEARRAVMAARTAPAPDMSFFIVAWVPSAGFRLMPPESYMIPLPTSVR